MIKQSLIDRLDKIKNKFAPNRVNVITVNADENIKQAKLRYEAENNIKLNDSENFVFVNIYPDYFEHKHVKYIQANERFVNQEMRAGKSLNEILKDI